MKDVKFITGVLKKVEDLTKEPQNYLSVQEDVASDLRELIKKVYDFNKQKEDYQQNNEQVLEELVHENLDEEQIWQQIELQNNFICKKLIVDISQFLVNKNNVPNDVNDEKDDLEASNNDNMFTNVEKSEDEYEDKSVQSENGDEFELNENSAENMDSEYESLESQDGETNNSHKKKYSSIVDDEFFKMSEMEEFLQKVENDKCNRSDDDSLIDYFEHYSSDSDEEHRNIHYNDFFDQPGDASVKRKRKKEKTSLKKKKVKFSFEDENYDEDDVEDDLENDLECNEYEGTENVEEKEEPDTISTFEARQERLKSRIKALEEEALKEKPWQLKGEVTATNRPQNSLLEEYVEFDSAVRPPPVITEKSTMKLEDIIKQRIKDKAWDDVERKIKPVEDPKEYKKRLVLDQEKSKLSLAQIYEQEYLKQKEAKNENAEEKPDEIPKEHLEIDKMMSSLFAKLDALSNFHFTPKMVSPEIKIISNLPAITAEEVAPVATSDATLLAPEEVKGKLKGDLIGRSERTKTDKKRERRLKKKKQKLRKKEMEQRTKSKVITKKDETNKKKKKKKAMNISNLKKDVTRLSDNGKYVRSSSAFFTKLQDEVKSQIKKKSEGVGYSQKANNFDVKKWKL